MQAIKINNFFKILLTFGFLYFSIFSVHFTFLPTYTQRIIMVIAIFHLLAVAATSKLTFQKDQSVATLLLCFTLFCFYNMLNTVVQTAIHYNIAKISFILLTQVLISSFYVSYLLRISEPSFEVVMFYLTGVFLLQAFFIIFFYVHPEFRAWVSGVLPLNRGLEELMFRSRGLTHQGGALLGLLQGIGVWCSFYLMYVATSKRVLFYGMSSLGTILISIFLSGRTGLLVLPILLITLILNSIKYRHITKTNLLAPTHAVFLRILCQSTG